MKVINERLHLYKMADQVMHARGVPDWVAAGLSLFTCAHASFCTTPSLVSEGCDRDRIIFLKQQVSLKSGIAERFDAND